VEFAPLYEKYSFALLAFFGFKKYFIIFHNFLKSLAEACNDNKLNMVAK
jgi:hypothetical protein